MNDKNKNIFVDLGKATLRGIRKCPKCGTFNGTRGLSCKNKQCRLVFKAGKEKKRAQPEVDAVKIMCPSPLQVYSVKLLETNEDNRCFVLLPIIEGIEALQDENEVIEIKRSAATCYATGCLKPVETTGTLSLNFNPCSHTHSVVNCHIEAEPLILKKLVLKAMPISEDMKEQIYSLVSKPDDQLVQRVTKNTVVVKCIADDLHPLGYLHFSAFEPSKKAKKFRILCNCQTQLTKAIVPREKQMCVHLYMCICAYASDTKLLEEYKPLIQFVLSSKSPGPIEFLLGMPEFDADLADLKAIHAIKEFFIEDIAPSPKRKKTNTISKTTEAFLERNNITKTPKKGNLTFDIKPFVPPEEVTVSISFEQWLASVTERINQTMHYQFSGCPDPLVFQVPQVFFDIFHKRLSIGPKKKRLPNSVIGFSTKDALPMGVFSKYIWQFTNILHVKRIFDTPEVPLEVTKSFIENRDGTFTLYAPLKEDEEDLAQNFRKTLNNLLIKPLELKTFLKVGNTSLEQKEPTPFIVEWIPNILPKTCVGQLTIKFEYGHQRNGIVEHRTFAQSITVPESSIMQDSQHTHKLQESLL